jgi:hypothetical protein
LAKQGIKMMLRMKTAGLTVLASAVLIACGGGGGGSSTTPAVINTNASSTYSGVAMAGNVSGATVTVYALNADGTLGSAIGTDTTKSDGSFSVKTSATSPRVAIKVTGGTYTSEADTSKTAVQGGEFLSVSFSESGETGLAVTPLTSMVMAYAMKTAATSGNIATAFNDAQTKLVKAYFDIDATGVNPINKIVPSFTTVSGPAGRAGLALAFFEQLAINVGVAPADLYAALAADSADGQLDGKGAGGAQVKVGTKAAAVTLFTADLLTAVNAYQTSVTSLHKQNLVDLTTASNAAAITQIRSTIATAASAVLAGTGIDVGSAGAVTQLSFAGSGGIQKQFVYVAARSGGVVAIDISDPAAPIITTLTTLNNALSARFLSSVGGIIAVPGAVTPRVVLFDYDNKTIHLADVNSQTILASKTISVTASASFSGASGYIAGGIADAKRNVIWLATADGYIALDPNTLNQVGTTIALANGDPISENMGGDPAADMLFSPNYGSSYENASNTRYWGQGGIQWVDLQSNTAYSMRPTDFQSLTGLDSATCVNSTYSLCAPKLNEPDQGAVDSVYKVGLIANEDSYGVIGAMMLDKASYTFDSVSKTFAAKTPATAFKTMKLSSPSVSGRLSGVVVESGNHYALLMSGNSSRIGVAKIDNPNAPANGTWAGFSDWRTYSASYSDGYSSVGDPHAAGAVKSINTGKSYGFLLADSYSGKVAMIDLEGFLKAAATNPTSADRTLAATPFNNTIIRTLTPQ